MSYYYNYYIGYMHEGKIYPLGPYNCKGKLKTALSNSRSFASDLHELFNCVQDDQISDELRKEFTWEDYSGEENMQTVKYLEVSEMPAGSFIKTGYFLIEDVERYEAGDYPDPDILWDRLSPTVYAAMAQNEKAFGRPPQRFDEDGDLIETHSASDYMYYAYPDLHSREYEAAYLRNLAVEIGEYDSELPKGYRLVILETEG